MAIPVDCFYLYEGGNDFGELCAEVCRRAGYLRTFDPMYAVFAVAPRLIRVLTPAEWTAPRLGTLIFHPSVLPYHRGPDAIRWTVGLGERVSGVTWFWCDAGLDAGPICEQEPVLLLPGESPGRAYHTRFIPAGLRALERAVEGIRLRRPRRLAQDEALASYEPRFPLNPIASVG